MSMIYDNWERLVAAVLDREHYRQLCRDDSSVYSIGSHSDSSSFTSPLNDVVSLHFPGPNINDAPSSSLTAQSVFQTPPSPNTPLRKKMVFKVEIHDDIDKKRIMKTALSFSGVESISMDPMLMQLTVVGVGDIDPEIEKILLHSVRISYSISSSAQRRNTISGPS